MMHLGFHMTKTVGYRRYLNTQCEAPATPIGIKMTELAGDECGAVIDSWVERKTQR